MPTMQQVTIDFSSDSPNVPEIGLEPENGIQWNFEGVPPESVPFIQFETGLGPFQCLQVVAGNMVQGQGNIGTNGESFPYTALLLNATGVQGPPRAGVVKSPTQDANTSPVVVVTVRNDSTPFDLNVDPPNLTLFPGDTALWHVHNLPADHFVGFSFTLPAGGQSLLGPFQSLLINGPVAGESSDVVRIIGDIFTPGDTTEFTYHVTLRDASGTVVASHDPVIDNLGDPPGPPIDETSS